MDCSPAKLLCSWYSLWVAIPFSRDLPDPGIEPGSPALQVDSLPSEPPGKPLMSIKLYQKTRHMKREISLNDSALWGD